MGFMIEKLIQLKIPPCPYFSYESSISIVKVLSLTSEARCGVEVPKYVPVSMQIVGLNSSANRRIWFARCIWPLKGCVLHKSTQFVGFKCLKKKVDQKSEKQTFGKILNNRSAISFFKSLSNLFQGDSYFKFYPHTYSSQRF